MTALRLLLLAFGICIGAAIWGAMFLGFSIEREIRSIKHEMGIR